MLLWPFQKCQIGYSQPVSLYTFRHRDTVLLGPDANDNNPSVSTVIKSDQRKGLTKSIDVFLIDNNIDSVERNSSRE